MKAYWAAARQRWIPHGAFFLVAWPLLSVALGGAILMEQEIVSDSAMPLRYVYFGLGAGAMRMLPEFAVSGALLTLVSVALFSIAAADAKRTIGEPVLFLLAAAAGVAREFPSVLAYPLLRPLRPLSVAIAEAAFIAAVVVFAVLLGYGQGRWKRAVVTTTIAAAVILGGYAVARAPMYEPLRIASPRTTLLFGIDSLSQSDDVRGLRALTEKYRGTWYSRPVTPAFTTNSVWASILMHRNVPDTGVFFIRQSPQWGKAPFNLVARAEREGFTTVSFFSDQFTAFEGSEGGFDIDRSGPKGWLQVATAATKDASIFLPLILPRIPPIPFAGTPANQSGTYAFDVRQEINAILSAGRFGQKTLVAAHLDYLHQPRFPAYSEVSDAERAIIRRSPVTATQDLSFNFQFPEIANDAFGLYRWKIRNLQRILDEEIARAKFLDPQRGNRLILFSDHGNRNGLDPRTYGDPKFHHVVLATFGVPARDPEAPISLAAIADLIGIDDPSRPRIEPTTTLAHVEWSDWEALGKSARLTWNGEYTFNPRLLAKIGRRMRSCRPWMEEPPYTPRPCE